MPGFICSRCGASDNTAYGGNLYAKIEDQSIEGPLCSKCLTGQWHDRFPYLVTTPAQAAQCKSELAKIGIVIENYNAEIPGDNPGPMSAETGAVGTSETPGPTGPTSLLYNG